MKKKIPYLEHNLLVVGRIHFSTTQELYNTGNTILQ